MFNTLKEKLVYYGGKGLALGGFLKQFDLA